MSSFERRGRKNAHSVTERNHCRCSLCLGWFHTRTVEDFTFSMSRLDDSKHICHRIKLQGGDNANYMSCVIWQVGVVEGRACVELRQLRKRKE